MIFEFSPDLVRDYKKNISYSESLLNDEKFVPYTFLTSFRDGEFKVFADLDLDLSQLLHAGHSYEFFAPLESGSRLKGQTTLHDIKHKSGKSGSLAFLSVKESFSTEDSRPVAEVTTLIVVREIENTPQAIALPQVDVPASLPRVSTSLLRLKEYARLSGDYNPIHVDPVAAKAAGLAGPIAHGMYGFDHLFRAIVEDSRLAGRRPLKADGRFMAMIPAESEFGISVALSTVNSRTTAEAKALLSSETAATSLRLIF